MESTNPHYTIASFVGIIVLIFNEIIKALVAFKGKVKCSCCKKTQNEQGKQEKPKS